MYHVTTLLILCIMNHNSGSTVGHNRNCPEVFIMKCMYTKSIWTDSSHLAIPLRLPSLCMCLLQ